MRTVAVVLAAGTGTRFGAGPAKQLRRLAGRTLVERSVAAFAEAAGIDQVLVVTAAELTAEVRTLLAGTSRLAAVIEGGSARSDSTRQAIAWLTAAASQDGGSDRMKVLFHDAARPLVDLRIITDCVEALDSWDAVGVVVPTTDTIVELAGGAFGRILPRDSLARCQTPQGFRLGVIRRAHELAAADPGFALLPATDDCGVVLRYLPEVPVGAVTGSERNLKITYASDLAVAEALLDPEDPPG
jgi:2-C-methyl-D-erythritol 4-phosphate cytidylyltransferase